MAGGGGGFVAGEAFGDALVGKLGGGPGVQVVAVQAVAGKMVGVGGPGREAVAGQAVGGLTGVFAAGVAGQAVGIVAAAHGELAVIDVGLQEGDRYFDAQQGGGGVFGGGGREEDARGRLEVGQALFQVGQELLGGAVCPGRGEGGQHQFGLLAELGQPGLHGCAGAFGRGGQAFVCLLQCLVKPDQHLVDFGGRAGVGQVGQPAFGNFQGAGGAVGGVAGQQHFPLLGRFLGDVEGVPGAVGMGLGQVG